MKGPALLLSLLLISLAATAQIYKTTDEQGNVVFTDQPPEGVEREEVELQRTNTAPPPPERPAPPPIMIAPPNPLAVPARCGRTDSVPAVAFGMTIPLPRPTKVMKPKNTQADP